MSIFAVFSLMIIIFVIIQNSMKKRYFYLLLFLWIISISFSYSQQVIGLWNFENGTQLPSIGNGTISLVGGVKVEWGRTGVQAGIALPEGRKETIDLPFGTGFQTLNYPLQGTNPKTAGVQIRFNTTGYKNILISADVRQGGTSANKLMLQYTVDGSTWEKAITYTTSDNNSWYQRNFNFRNIPGVNNNPLFAVRFVTNFDDDVVGSEVYVPVSATNLYSTTGPIRYDNIVIRGYPLNEPEDDRITISSWNFDNQQLTPSEGAGSLTLEGGINYDNLWTRTGIFTNQTIFDQGVYDFASLKTGFGLQTIDYPMTGNEKTAGIKLNISTLNYKDINISADIRHGGTSANKLALQYTIDNNIWKDAMTYTSNSGDTWYIRNFDFSGITEVENNSQFSLRFVTAYDGAGYAASGIGKVYASTGPIRFDNIRLSGRLRTSLNDNTTKSTSFYISEKVLYFIQVPTKFTIYNISGMKVLEGTNETRLNLEAFTSGVYLIQLENVIEKFILR